MKSTDTRRIEVRAASGKYAIVCGRGVLREAEKEIARLGKFSSVQILSSPKVWKALGGKIGKSFGAESAKRVILFDDAEAAKNLRTVESVTRALVKRGADRGALVVAVGGGVVGDMSGYVAASYLRGVAVVQVPTTVVAQVDSAVGGKTGVNLPEGKNLVGAFYPPRLVLVDPEALGTLAEREFRGGLAEVIKYGVIADAKLFAFLEREMDAILRREARPLEHVIRRSLEIKAAVVSKDEKESGLREILNFGHTFGHALESATKYKKFQHGEAVAWGMMCAALLGHEVAGMKAEEVSRIVTLVRRIGPLPAWPKVKAGALISLMRADKKTRGGKLRFVVARKIGRAETMEGVEEKTVERILRCAPDFFAAPVRMMGKSDG